MRTVRDWIERAGLSVEELHERLEPGQFKDEAVPKLKQVRGGEERPVRRTARGRTEVVAQGAGGPTPLPEVSAAAMLRLSMDLAAARQSLLVSDQRQGQALQLSTLLPAHLGQARAAVAELTWGLAEARGARGSLPSAAGPTDARLRLELARERERDVREALTRAERQAAAAQELAESAVRRVRELEGRTGPAVSAAALPHAGRSAADPLALESGGPAWQQADAPVPGGVPCPAARLPEDELTAFLYRAMLPAVAAEPEELVVAWSLVPAAPSGAARHCWYDVLPLGGGRSALVSARWPAAACKR
ncbi:hypothetical protein ACWFQ8_18330 [Streptomyces sp. NPDC055254]